jgi:hypothetical protein
VGGFADTALQKKKRTIVLFCRDLRSEVRQWRDFF